MNKTQTQPLRDENLKALLKEGESESVEFTESVKNKDKIAEAICAFSNNLDDIEKPGVIFIGVKDNGDFSDLSVTDEMLQSISAFSRHENLDPFPLINVQKWIYNSHEVIVVKVHPSKYPPMRHKGRCYVRIGPTVRIARKQEENNLLEKRQSAHQPEDMRGVAHATVKDDLDMDYFRTFYLPSAVSREIVESNNRETNKQMRSLRLLDHHNQPTMTAILLMGIDPRQWFPGAYIQFIRFEGKELTDPVRDQKEIVGTLPNQIRRIEEILNSHNSVALSLSDTTHIQSSDYPDITLNQLIRNALMHRDYKSHNPVKVYWFSDRIEIQSPGGPYGALNKDNFGEEGLTDYRNPNIAIGLKNLHFVEQFGIGLPKARKALKVNGHPDLKLEAADSFILAVIPGKNQP